jgi:hypothetical protein
MKSTLAGLDSNVARTVGDKEPHALCSTHRTFAYRSMYSIPDPASAFIKNYEVYEGAADAPSSVKAGRRCSR